MDMKKIGSFLKTLRREKGLTQEQLAERLGVAGRTVSRWETASNMPDFSILIQLAEFYDVEIGEILDGERKDKDMDKELKATLTKVADYSEANKKKFADICSLVLFITFIVCTITLVVQLILFGNIQYIIGETVTILISGMIAIAMTVKNGLWDISSKKKASHLRDMITSGIMTFIFTVAGSVLIYSNTGNIKTTTVFALVFFIVIFTLGFIVLHILAKMSKKNEHSKGK